MKKLLIICILIVSVIFISGCTSEEKTDTDTKTDTVQSSKDVLFSDKNVKSDWYKIGENQLFDIGDGIIIEVNFNMADFMSIETDKLSQIMLNDQELTFFIRYKDSQGNELFNGQPIQRTVGGMGYPNNAAFWQIEMKLAPTFHPTPTPTKVPIKLD